MVTSLEGLTLEEVCTIMEALRAEMLRFQALLEQDDYWFYRRKIETIYDIFGKMGYTRKEADRFINY